MLIELIDKSTKKKLLINLNNIFTVIQKVSEKKDHEHNYIVISTVSGRSISVDMTYVEFSELLERVTQPQGEKPGTGAMPSTQETSEAPRSPKTVIGGGSKEI